jgi:hypothetical protein
VALEELSAVVLVDLTEVLADMEWLTLGLNTIKLLVQNIGRSHTSMEKKLGMKDLEVRVELIYSLGVVQAEA